MQFAFEFMNYTLALDPIRVIKVSYLYHRLVDLTTCECHVKPVVYWIRALLDEC
jgi:hypothetical protein